MKKILLSVLSLLLAAALLFGCEKRPGTVLTLEESIRNIGRSDADPGEELASIRDAYEALAEPDREKVRNIEKLEEAEAEYENLRQINADIKAILDIANASFTDAKEGISRLIERAEEIKKLYRKMSGREKKLVHGLDELDDAVKKLEQLAANTETPAVAYVKAFLQVNAGKNYTVTGVYCVKNVREGDTEYHVFALTYADAAGETHAVYSTARATAEVTADSIAAHPEIFFADAPVAADLDAIENGNVTLDLEAVLAAAAE